MESKAQLQRVLPNVESIKADMNRVSLIASERKIIGSNTMQCNIYKRYKTYLSTFLKERSSKSSKICKSCDENSLDVILKNNLQNTIGADKKPVK